MKSHIKLKPDHKYNLFFGLHEGTLKHISEVANGISCNCVCPACEKKLVARNGGNKRIHHFAHYESKECKYGVQTSIHIAAKQILQKRGRIKVPANSVFINTEIEKEEHQFISHGEFQSISNEMYIQYDAVVLEKKLHKFIPDVVILAKNKKLIIEIAVTHFVGRQKIDNIISSEISAIEIDLSKLDYALKLEDLENLIIDSTENKTWLHNEFAKQQSLLRRQLMVSQIDYFNEIKRLELEKRESWYRQFYKQISSRRTSSGYLVQHVDDCPLKLREFNGKYYANLKLDCANCLHSRWLRERGKFLVCLHDRKEQKEIS